MGKTNKIGPLDEGADGAAPVDGRAASDAATARARAGAEQAADVLTKEEWEAAEAATLTEVANDNSATGNDAAGAGADEDEDEDGANDSLPAKRTDPDMFPVNRRSLNGKKSIPPRSANRESDSILDYRGAAERDRIRALENSHPPPADAHSVPHPLGRVSKAAATDEDELNTFPWTNQFHNDVSDEKKLIIKAKKYWRRQFRQFEQEMKLINQEYFFDPLGYFLNLRVQKGKTLKYLALLRVFFRRLRTFDQIDGRMEKVKDAEEIFGDEYEEEDEDAQWPPSGDELYHYFHEHKEAGDSHGDGSTNTPKGSFLPFMSGRKNTTARLKRDQVAQAREIDDFDPRMLLDMWTQIRKKLFDTWEDVSHTSELKIHAVHGISDYEFDVREFVSRCYSRDPKVMIIPGEHAAPLDSSDHQHASIPKIEQHIAELAAIFNFGGALRLAVSAEQPQIARELLVFHRAFKLLTSLCHTGEKRRLLLGPLDSSSTIVQNLISNTPPVLDRIHDRATDGQKKRIRCYNCADPHGTNAPKECKRCCGPRCTDDVSMRQGLDWNYERSSSKDYIYFDPFWGWEWPMHPVHSRSTNGRNALCCAVQAGDMECVEVLLSENPDLLSVTFGGDTLLHYAARFDNDQVLFRLLLAIVSPGSAMLKLDRYKEVDRGTLKLRQSWDTKKAPAWIRAAPPTLDAIFPTPLHDLSYSLRKCEESLAEAVHAVVGDETKKKASRPMCPCRCMDPMANVWNWADNDKLCYVDDDGQKISSHRQRRYGRCHGLIGREDADSGDLLTLPGDDGTGEDMNSMMTAESVRALPRLLDKIRAEHDGMTSLVDRKCSLISALAVFRDMRNEAGRTALHSAAFMDRDNSCKALLALGSDPSVRDRFSVSALQLMVANIPQSAATALDRFHRIDKSARIQYYYLLKLETTDTREPTIRDQHCRKLIRPAINNKNPQPRTLLQEITLHERRGLITHPVVEQLCAYKWNTFGKFYHAFETLKYAAYLLSWSAVAYRQPFEYCSTGDLSLVSGNCTGVFMHRNDYRADVIHFDDPMEMAAGLEHQYNDGAFVGAGAEMGGQGFWWLFVECYAFLWSLYYVYQEAGEGNLRSRIAKFHRTFSLQSLDHMAIGLADRSNLSANDYEHQITAAIEESKKGSQYFADSSNYLDIVMLICLPLSFSLQRCNQFYGGSVGVARAAGWLLSIGLVVAWFNLLKFLRALKSFGPLYVMLMKMGADIRNFLVLYVCVSIPFAIVFQMYFGKDTGASEQFGTFPKSFVSMFHLLMVDFDSGAIAETDYNTAVTLYVLWVFTSAVVLLNLFIAMMSATFQNAYDDKDAVWALERANIISRAEEYISKSLVESKFFDFHDQDVTVMPEVVRKFQNGDNESLEKYISYFKVNGDDALARPSDDSYESEAARDHALYSHKDPNTGKDVFVKKRKVGWYLPRFYHAVAAMTDDFKSPQATTLEEYLNDEYDDPDEETDISVASVRSKMLAAVTRLEDQQEQMASKLEKVAHALRHLEEKGVANARNRPHLPSINVRDSARTASAMPSGRPVTPSGASGGRISVNRTMIPELSTEESERFRLHVSQRDAIIDASARMSNVYQ